MSNAQECRRLAEEMQNIAEKYQRGYVIDVVKRYNEAISALSAAADAQERTEQHQPCPCLHTTPCHPRCACLHPQSSQGCKRCCTYGSALQQLVRAEYLVSLQDETEEREAYLRSERKVMLELLEEAAKVDLMNGHDAYTLDDEWHKRLRALEKVKG